MTVKRAKRSPAKARKEGCACPETSLQQIRTRKRKPTMLEVFKKLKLKVDRQLEKNRSQSPFRPPGDGKYLEY